MTSEYDKTGENLEEWWRSMPNETVSDSRTLFDYTALWDTMTSIENDAFITTLQGVSNLEPVRHLNPYLKIDKLIKQFEKLLGVLQLMGWNRDTGKNDHHT